MSRRALLALALGAGAVLACAGPATGASRTLTLDGWSARSLAFSGANLVWTETATVRVDPARIPGSPAGAGRFDYYRAETSRARLDRRSLRFLGRPETPVAVRTSIAAMSPGVLWPVGGGDFLMVPGSRRFPPPVVRCCDDDGVETVVESDGRADAPVTVSAFASGTAVAMLRLGAGGVMSRRDVDLATGVASETPLGPASARPGLAVLTPGALAWVRPEDPATLLVQPTGVAAPVAVALRGRAVRLWATTGTVVAAVRRGPRSVVLLRVDDGTAPRVVRAWGGRRVPRVAVGGGSVAVADGRRVLAARRGAVRRVTTARRVVDAVGVHGRRLAWVERGRRKGARVGVMRLGRVR